MDCELSVVWLKRDLRWRDHLAMKAAIDAGHPILLLFVCEPSWLGAPDTDVRHVRFVFQSLEDMRLHPPNPHFLPLILQGEVVEILDALRVGGFQIKLFSHVEVGTRRTFERDIAVKNWCRSHGVVWTECKNFGITRGRKHRREWSHEWLQWMEQPVASPEYSKAIPASADSLSNFCVEDIRREEWCRIVPGFQPGGPALAQRYMESFFEDRIHSYMASISQPLAARTGCSRLSPYLAWGNLSIREVWQRATLRPVNKKNLRFFLARLHWHCHFIQKFESECSMEFFSVNKGFHTINKQWMPQRVSAWEMGKTGVPLVDACMRCLRDTGYLNFRMRAMVVSFFTHHLWQPWQAAAHFLARMFLDYEPGIHYPQLQMQAGETGVNTIRIYNPVLQGKEQDPDALFLRQWIPELHHVPVPLIFEPWKMSMMEQALYQCRIGIDYPAPIVDVEEASAYARDTLWKLRKLPSVQKENKRILMQHTVRRDERENPLEAPQ